MSLPVLLEGSPPHTNEYSLILAVNDNFDSLNLLCAILRDQSFNVLTAESGFTALEIVKNIRPDLIISDVVMPGIDGIELCRRLKSNPATGNIPVLLMTALRYDEAAIVEGLRAGADDYVQAHAPIELFRKKVEHLIAEHKRTEAARLESETHFQTLIENSLDIITIVNADGTIRYESPSVERVLGYKPEELVGKSAFEFVHPDDVRSLVKVFTQGIQTENYAGCTEFRFRHKDGSWRVLEAIGKNLLNQPRVSGVIVNSRDVTERKQMEAVLRESEERHKLAMDAVKDYAIFMLDPEGFVVSWNAGAERIKGYRAEEILGQHFSRFFTRADIELGKPQYELQIAVAEGSHEYEGWSLRQDGSRFWANVVLTALRDDQGHLKGFLKVTRDMTERREREEALRKSEQLLRALLDNSPALIYIKDIQGRYVVVNRQFESVFKLNKEEIIGKTAHELFARETADVIRANDRRAIESCSPVEVEETAVTDKGTSHYISIIFPLNDSAGKPYAVCGISTDISAHKSLEEQLRHSQKMEAIGMLAGGVAHDFNNLLTAIIGYSQLLLFKHDKSDPQWVQIEEIEKAGRRASALTNQLLAFSRKQILQPQLLDLNLVIENLTKLLRRLIGEDIELVATLDSQLRTVKADPGCIEQVIMNLAVNARDAMPHGGKLTIETANVDLESEYPDIHMGVPPGDYVMLAVSDTGCGMDKETQARIFDPFFTTKEPGKGTGLGLSTVYGIVKQSGGHIWIFSELDHGSSFKIYFPKVDGVAKANDTLQETVGSLDGSETVLLVEDEEAVRRLARTVLEGKGYTVLEAASAKEALQRALAYAEEIHVLVTDIVMPEMDGRALADSVALRLPDIKVIYVSGYTDQAIVQHIVLEQGKAFLQKPFTPETLARKVRQALDTPAVREA